MQRPPLDSRVPVTPADTPVLLLTWRRPHTLRHVIDAIRPIAPGHLFVASDGPRADRPEEAAQVAATRRLIDDAIDWPCRIERRYSDVHQGCHLGVSRAITWFFEQVEAGIILEDDCVPHPDFFRWTTELLAHYRDDTRVWCLSGGNRQDGAWRGEASYFFGRIPLVWGWATWRRCWMHYDDTLARWPALRDGGLLETLFEDPRERQYWRTIWQRLVDEGTPDSWAYRWVFTCVSQGGLTAMPNRNLVANIGFGDDATHTRTARFATPIDQGLDDPITHPAVVRRSAEADAHYFRTRCERRERFPALVRRLVTRTLRLGARTATAWWPGRR